jgi:serine/threonine protein kinase
MIDMLGPLPKGLAERWTRSSKYFTPPGVQFNSNPKESAEEGDPLSEKVGRLEEYLEQKKSKDLPDKSAEEVMALLRQILQWDPAKRPSASELLQNPWFCEEGRTKQLAPYI